jgi:hypothetical protein
VRAQIVFEQRRDFRLVLDNQDPSLVRLHRAAPQAGS